MRSVAIYKKETRTGEAFIVACANFSRRYVGDHGRHHALNAAIRQAQNRHLPLAPKFPLKPRERVTLRIAGVALGTERTD